MIKDKEDLIFPKKNLYDIYSNYYSKRIQKRINKEIEQNNFHNENIKYKLDSESYLFFLKLEISEKRHTIALLSKEDLKKTLKFEFNLNENKTKEMIFNNICKNELNYNDSKIDNRLFYSRHDGDLLYGYFTKFSSLFKAVNKIDNILTEYYSILKNTG